MGYTTGLVNNPKKLFCLRSEAESVILELMLSKYIDNAGNFERIIVKKDKERR